MLKFDNTSVTYSNGTKALIDFNLQMKAGEIVLLVGESGSGKTTAIRATMGLLPVGGSISHGDIFFNGQSLKNLSVKAWQKIRGQEISMIFQDSGAMLNPIRTIGSQCVEYMQTHSEVSKQEARKQIKNMLEGMGLYDGEAIMNAIPAQLSGGMRQRVGITMAMLFKAKLILADEPTSALDVTTQAQIVKQIMTLRKDYATSILMVTHNIGVAAYMADKIVVMLHGRIVEMGDRESIIHNPQHNYTKQLLKAIPDVNKERYV